MSNLTTESDFSVGKEAAHFATTFIQNNIKEISKIAKYTLNLASTELRIRLDRTYSNYLNCVGERYSKVKTFLFNQEPHDLFKFYVPLGVSVGNTNYLNVTISDLTLTNNFNIITGSAGSGKSIMMRYLFLDSIKQHEKIPIFLELRELNSIDGSLLNVIKRKLADNKFDFGDKFIERAFELGYFILFLDGFDELAESKQREIAEEILFIFKHHDKNQIIVSSRPDNYFSH